MGPAVVHTMRDLTSGVFGHLYIPSTLIVDKMFNYMQRILSVPPLDKYNTVLEECKDLTKVVAGYQWTLVSKKDVNMEKLWTWLKQDGVGICWNQLQIRFP